MGIMIMININVRLLPPYYDLRGRNDDMEAGSRKLQLAFLNMRRLKPATTSQRAFQHNKGAVLLGVLFFALFFAVLISKIFSTLHETKASSPRTAGAKIERYVAETAMVQIRGRCNQLRTRAEQYVDLPGPPTGTAWFDNCTVVGGNYDCAKTYNIGVDLNSDGTTSANENFAAAATVTITDIDPGAGVQWDCGQINIETKVQK